MAAGLTRLVEPWDSPFNLERPIPWAYTPVRGKADKPPYVTHLRMFVGKGAVFEYPDQQVTLSGLQARGNLADILLVVEAAETVPWTMPEVLPYEADRPLPPLGGTFKDGFYGLFADGSVRFIRHDTDERTIRAYITGRMAE
jgi:hypothetical protein